MNSEQNTLITQYNNLPEDTNRDKYNISNSNNNLLNNEELERFYGNYNLTSEDKDIINKHKILSDHSNNRPHNLDNRVLNNNIIDKLVLQSKSKSNSKSNELLNLEKKYNELYKAYDKLLKKLRDHQDEKKNIKNDKERFLKELHSITIFNDKLKEEIEAKNNKIKTQAEYISRLENRLLQSNKLGSGSYQNEINNLTLTLNNKDYEIEKLLEFIKTLKHEVDDLKYQVNKKNSEIKIYSKTLMNIKLSEEHCTNNASNINNLNSNNSTNNLNNINSVNNVSGYSNLYEENHDNNNIQVNISNQHSNTSNNLSNNNTRFPTKSTLIFELESLKSKLEEKADQIDYLSNSVNKLQNECEEKNNKVIELTFAKSSLAEMLIETEAKLSREDKENRRLHSKVQELEKEKEVLTDYLEKLDKSNKETFDKINKDNISLQSMVKENETTINMLNEKTANLSNDIKFYKENISMKSDKIQHLVKTLEDKNALIIDLESKHKIANSAVLSSNQENCKLAEELERITNQHNLLKDTFSNLEKENLFLLNKTQELVIDNNADLNKLILENNKLSTNEKSLKEQINILNGDLEKIKSEKHEYKKLCYDTVEKNQSISKENEILKKDKEELIETKSNLHNKVLNLQKMLASSVNDDYNNSCLQTQSKLLLDTNKNNVKKCLDIIIDKGDFFEEKIISKTINDSRVNILDVLRKEKEKNKEFISEIKKLKNSMN